MRVLLLGASGLLSGAARDALLAAGHDVTVVSRGTRPVPSHARLTVLRADRAEPRALAATLGGATFDLTVDFLAYDGDDVTRLFAIPGFAPGRVVIISTGQVYLVTRDPRPPFREEDADAPTIDEPERDTRAWHNWVYGMGKRAAEAALRREGTARGVPTLALRLPVVQGEEDGHASQRLWGWIERLRDGGPVLLPEDGVQSLRFVYVGDAARALVRLAELEPWPAAPALNLAQPEEITLRALLEQVATILGTTPRFVSVTAAQLEAAGLDDCAPFWGRWCSRPDPTAALAALGFRTRGPDAYLASVVAGHLAHPAPSHPGYARRAEELALAARLGG
jgi:2'-hydroxyisoflavone reductase